MWFDLVHVLTLLLDVWHYIFNTNSKQSKNLVVHFSNHFTKCWLNYLLHFKNFQGVSNLCFKVNHLQVVLDFHNVYDCVSVKNIQGVNNISKSEVFPYQNNSC